MSTELWPEALFHIPVPEPPPHQSVTFFGPAIFHPRTTNMQTWESECFTPILARLRPRLRPSMLRQPLVFWGHFDGFHWTVAFHRLPSDLVASLLDLFRDDLRIPASASLHAWDMRHPGVWAPWCLWSATGAWGFAGPDWTAPQDLPEALPVRDGPLSVWSLHAVDSEGTPSTPATTRFCTALATLFHWGYPTITRASLHRVYRTMEWPWHPQIRLWWNHAPYWHYAWTHQTALALPRTIETESLLRVWTAAQVATYWPVSAATIRRTVWSAIPTTVRHFRVHGRLIATRVASGDDCETWRSQHHPEWPPLPGDTDPLLEDDPSYRWDPETRQLLPATPSMLL